MQNRIGTIMNSNIIIIYLLHSKKWNLQIVALKFPIV